MDNHVGLSTLKSFVKKLRIPDNSIVLVKQGSPIDNHDDLKLLAETIHRAGVDGVVVISVADFNDLKVLDSIDMQKYGWYRKEDIGKLFKLP